MALRVIETGLLDRPLSEVERLALARHGKLSPSRFPSASEFRQLAEQVRKGTISRRRPNKATASDLERYRSASFIINARRERLSGALGTPTVSESARERFSSLPESERKVVSGRIDRTSFSGADKQDDRQTQVQREMSDDFGGGSGGFSRRPSGLQPEGVVIRDKGQSAFDAVRGQGRTLSGEGVRRSRELFERRTNIRVNQLTKENDTRRSSDTNGRSRLSRISDNLVGQLSRVQEEETNPLETGFERRVGRLVESEKRFFESPEVQGFTSSTEKIASLLTGGASVRRKPGTKLSTSPLSEQFEIVPKPREERGLLAGGSQLIVEGGLNTPVLLLNAPNILARPFARVESLLQPEERRVPGGVISQPGDRVFREDVRVFKELESKEFSFIPGGTPITQEGVATLGTALLGGALDAVVSTRLSRARGSKGKIVTEKPSGGDVVLEGRDVLGQSTKFEVVEDPVLGTVRREVSSQRELGPLRERSPLEFADDVVVVSDTKVSGKQFRGKQGQSQPGLSQDFASVSEGGTQFSRVLSPDEFSRRAPRSVLDEATGEVRPASQVRLESNIFEELSGPPAKVNQPSKGSPKSTDRIITQLDVDESFTLLQRDRPQGNLGGKKGRGSQPEKTVNIFDDLDKIGEQRRARLERFENEAFFIDEDTGLFVRVDRTARNTDLPFGLGERLRRTEVTRGRTDLPFLVEDVKLSASGKAKKAVGKAGAVSEGVNLVESEGSQGQVLLQEQKVKKKKEEQEAVLERPETKQESQTVQTTEQLFGDLESSSDLLSTLQEQSPFSAISKAQGKRSKVLSQGRVTLPVGVQDSDVLLDTSQVLDTTQVTTQDTDQVLLLDTGLLTGQVTAQATRQVQQTQQLLSQDLLLDSLLGRDTTARTRRGRKKKTPKPKPRVDFERDSFSVVRAQVRKGGKWQDLFVGGRDRAGDRALREVRNTPRASLRFLVGGQVVNPNSVIGDTPKDFRRSKVNDNVLVEKTGSRIDSRGELAGITEKGQRARRGIF